MISRSAPSSAMSRSSAPVRAKRSFHERLSPLLRKREVRAEWLHRHRREATRKAERHAPVLRPAHQIAEVITPLHLGPREDGRVRGPHGLEHRAEQHRPPHERRAGSLRERRGLRRAEVREGRREVPVEIERVSHVRLLPSAFSTNSIRSCPQYSSPPTTNAGAPKIPSAIASSVRRRRSSFTSVSASRARIAPASCPARPSTSRIVACSLGPRPSTQYAR